MWIRRSSNVHFWLVSLRKRGRGSAKSFLTCSVEKLFTRDDHDVVGEYAELYFAGLRPVGACSESRAKRSFEHAVDGLYLPALAVLLEIEASPHSLPPVALQALRGGAAARGGNQRADATLVPGILVCRLTVITGVGGQRYDLHTPGGLCDDGAKIGIVRAGATAGCHTQY